MTSLLKRASILATPDATEPLLLCPEGAACLTATKRLRATGWIDSDEQVVVVNTGARLKYPDTISAQGLAVLSTLGFAGSRGVGLRDHDDHRDLAY